MMSIPAPMNRARTASRTLRGEADSWVVIRESLKCVRIPRVCRPRIDPCPLIPVRYLHSGVMSSSEKPEARAADPEIAAEMEAVYCLYAALTGAMDPETGLGGKLVYAGEPDEAGCRLLRAANIAGAASLAASADAPALRRAMHQGAIDFVVTSLDEALRILKNEIRKKQPVAVGISLATEIVVREMVERGVQPDLLAPDVPHAQVAEFFARGAHRIQPQPLAAGQHFDFIPIPPEVKQPTGAFDARLLDCMAAGDHVNRRWIRLAPRYLPAAARRIRLVVRGRER